MGEAYVDLLYRGLPLGNRARISQFDAQHAYVELPAPMPVGTAISLHVEAAGSPIAAQVVEIVEQTAGSERPPGMKVRALLDGEEKRAWWREASGNPAVLDGAAKLVEDDKGTAAPPLREIKPSTTDVMAVATPEPAKLAEPSAQPSAARAQASPEPAAEEPPAGEEKLAGSTEVMPAMTEEMAEAVAEAASAAEAKADADAAIVQPVSEEENTSVTSSAPVEAVSDEPSGVVDTGDAPEAPTASDAAPRGRGKRKKPNRR